MAFWASRRCSNRYPPHSNQHRPRCTGTGTFAEYISQFKRFRQHGVNNKSTKQKKTTYSDQFADKHEYENSILENTILTNTEKIKKIMKSVVRGNTDENIRKILKNLIEKYNYLNLILKTIKYTDDKDDKDCYNCLFTLSMISDIKKYGNMLANNKEFMAQLEEIREKDMFWSSDEAKELLDKLRKLL